jgi:hypothetical protein
MMVALDRGGAAGKTPNFCCCCDKNNETRGNVIFDNGEEVVEFGINDYAAQAKIREVSKPQLF